MCLLLTVVEAKNVGSGMDLETDIVDPYVQVRFTNRQIQRTRVIDNTSSPYWNQEFSFPVTNLATDMINLILKKRNLFDEDEDLAKLEIPLSQISTNEPQDVWMPMQSIRQISSSTQIHLNFRFTTGPQPSMKLMQPGMMYQRMLIPGGPILMPPNMGLPGASIPYSPQMMGQMMMPPAVAQPVPGAVPGAVPGIPQMIAQNAQQQLTTNQVMMLNPQTQMWSPYQRFN